MDLQSLALPDWLPWWVVVAALVPIALYLALFLLMPFQTFGLRARLSSLEARLEELHEEIRALTLRLPERGMDPYDPGARAQPPIPPAAREAAPRGGFGDPVADRMLAYMRDKAQSDLNRQPQGPRPRAEPRLGARPLPPRAPEADLPPPPGPPEDDYPPEPPSPPLRPPRVPGRYGRRPTDDDRGEPRIDWPR